MNNPQSALEMKAPAPRRAGSLVARFRADRRGTTALEFGFVAAPFFVLMMAIMTVGLHFFTIHSLENGVTTAARKLRTGEAQKAGMTYTNFRKLVCDEAGSFIKCDGHLVVHVKSGSTFADLDPPIACLTNGNLTPTTAVGSAPVSNQSGNENATVSVTACYQWDQGTDLWQGIWNMLTVGPWSSGGAPRTQPKTIIQATTAFRTEPYK